MNPTLSPIQNYLLENSPHYTSSLDAAIALAERVLPGWEWGVDAGWHGAERSVVAYVDKDTVAYQANASTPALALCIAILRAVEAGK